MESASQNAIVVCSDARMLPAACCTLLSAARCTTLLHRLFIVVEGEADVSGINDFGRMHNLTIEILRHNGADRAGSNAETRFSSATLTRLYLDEILPPELRRVLYLDSDMLVFSNLGDLFAIDMIGYSIAAVDDLAHKVPKKQGQRDQRKAQLGMKPESRYFNAGSMLFDWQSMKQNQRLPRALSLFKCSPEKFAFLDQDVLNVIANGNFFPLDIKWNRRPRLTFIREGVAHFVGAQKPWHRNPKARYAVYQKIYSDYLTGSPWPDFVQPLSFAARVKCTLLNLLTSALRAAPLPIYR